MNKHTPGPWGYQLGAVVDADNWIVADVRSRFDEGMSGEDYHFGNAALLAAAPDLLAALTTLLADQRDASLPALAMARAAIARATGGKQ